MVPRAAAAQGNTILERLNLDRLQLVSLGAWAGPIRPSQVDATSIFGVSADYGEITRGVRIVFGVSFWQSHYTDDVVRAFVDSLNRSLVNPGPNTTIAPSEISLYDVTFSGELRWTKTSPAAVSPYVSIGASAHVINADGALINGTFAERSLDDIAAGIFVAMGAQVRVVNHFGLEGSVRVDLLSGFRSIQGRGGFNYYFGHLRSMNP